MTTDTSNAPDVAEGRMLRTAAKIFRREGYAGGSTRAIAKAWGLQKGTLYYRFKDKEDILYRACVHALTAVRANLTEINEGPGTPIERLDRFIQTHMQTMLDDVDMHAVMLLEFRRLTGDARSSVRGLRREYVQLVTRLIEECQEAGEIRRDISPDKLTMLLLGLLNWTTVWYHEGGKWTSADLGDGARAIFLEGVRTMQGGETHSAGRLGGK